ncbi:MAG: hypothetical protein GY856_15645 [bacterium]|nr:hypothetical protein [bacterium]
MPILQHHYTWHTGGAWTTIGSSRGLDAGTIEQLEKRSRLDLPPDLKSIGSQTPAAERLNFYLLDQHRPVIARTIHLPHHKGGRGDAYFCHSLVLDRTEEEPCPLPIQFWQWEGWAAQPVDSQDLESLSVPLFPQPLYTLDGFLESIKKEDSTGVQPDLICRSLDAFIKHLDGGKGKKLKLIGTTPGELVNWIGVISLCLPRALAMRLTFSTHVPGSPPEEFVLGLLSSQAESYQDHYDSKKRETRSLILGRREFSITQPHEERRDLSFSDWTRFCRSCLVDEEPTRAVADLRAAKELFHLIHAGKTKVGPVLDQCAKLVAGNDDVRSSSLSSAVVVLKRTGEYRRASNLLAALRGIFWPTDSENELPEPTGILMKTWIEQATKLAEAAADTSSNFIEMFYNIFSQRGELTNFIKHLDTLGDRRAASTPATYLVKPLQNAIHRADASKVARILGACTRIPAPLEDLLGDQAVADKLREVGDEPSFRVGLSDLPQGAKDLVFATINPPGPTVAGEVVAADFVGRAERHDHGGGPIVDRKESKVGPGGEMKEIEELLHASEDLSDVYDAVLKQYPDPTCSDLLRFVELVKYTIFDTLLKRVGITVGTAHEARALAAEFDAESLRALGLVDAVSDLLTANADPSESDIELISELQPYIERTDVSQRTARFLEARNQQPSARTYPDSHSRPAEPDYYHPNFVAEIAQRTPKPKPHQIANELMKSIRSHLPQKGERNHRVWFESLFWAFQHVLSPDIKRLFTENEARHLCKNLDELIEMIPSWYGRNRVNGMLNKAFPRRKTLR